MKKLINQKVTSIFLLVLLSFSSLAVNGAEAVAPKTEAPASAEVQKLMNRLEEINTMEKKGLTSTEKKELRKEVKSIKEEMRRLGGGVYISVGAIIIILLLLIILL